jgi:uncharacterized protein (DUF2267 family)
LNELARSPEVKEYTLNPSFEKVADREGIDLPASTHHARAVISVLQEAVSAGGIMDVRDQLSDEFDPMIDSGSEGELQARRSV